MGNSSKDDSGSDGDTSSGDNTPSNTSLFTEGERVLAFHGPHIYEAKLQFECAVYHQISHETEKMMIQQMMMAKIMAATGGCGDIGGAEGG